MQCDCCFLENYVFLVYMYYTQPSQQTSIVGKNCAYYIRIFTVGYNNKNDTIQDN